MASLRPRVQIPPRPPQHTPRYKILFFNVMWKLKQQGYADRTIEGYIKKLKFLHNRTDINKPDLVNSYIARMEVSNTYKEGLVNVYNNYVKFNGLTWDKPNYKRDERRPNIATTEQNNRQQRKKIQTYEDYKVVLKFFITPSVSFHLCGMTQFPPNNVIFLIHPASLSIVNPRILPPQTGFIFIFKIKIYWKKLFLKNVNPRSFKENAISFNSYLIKK